jgi:glycosyltransferase involved in cell wall biosynthesis
VPNTVLLYTRFAGVRVADVIAIWSALRKRIPETRLTVIGRGLDGEEAELARLDGVTPVGWVSSDALPEWFARSAIAVIPWSDTPTNRARNSAKLLELMAAEMPIVAYAVGEIPMTLGDAGLLVAPGDSAAFASAVADLLNDPALARSLGAAARARACAEFTWGQLADRALEAYRIASAHRALRR